MLIRPARGRVIPRRGTGTRMSGVILLIGTIRWGLIGGTQLRIRFMAIHPLRVVFPVVVWDIHRVRHPPTPLATTLNRPGLWQRAAKRRSGTEDRKSTR